MEDVKELVIPYIWYPKSESTDEAFIIESLVVDGHYFDVGIGKIEKSKKKEYDIVYKRTVILLERYKRLGHYNVIRKSHKIDVIAYSCLSDVKDNEVVIVGGCSENSDDIAKSELSPTNVLNSITEFLNESFLNKLPLFNYSIQSLYDGIFSIGELLIYSPPV